MRFSNRRRWSTGTDDLSDLSFMYVMIEYNLGDT